MGYVVPAGFSRVSFKYAAVNAAGSLPVWGFGCDSAPSSVVLENLQDWSEDVLRPFTGNAWVLQTIEMRNDFQVLETAVGWQGAYGDAQSPPNLAALVRLSTGQVGRDKRGRIYLPGVLSDGSVGDDGTITLGKQEQIQDAIDDLRSVLLGVDATELYILHSAEQAPTLVTTAIVERIAATQRRRLRK